MVNIKLTSIMQKQLKKSSRSLVTRETGRIILDRIEREIRASREGKVIFLDFSGVKVIDYSCADEVIAKLLTRLIAGEIGNRYIVLRNLSDSHKENISVALERKYLAILATENKRNWEVVGTINNYLRETLELVMHRKRITVRELSNKLKLELNTASTRLLNLHKLKLVKKIAEKASGGRRQFVYESLIGEGK